MRLLLIRHGPTAHTGERLSGRQAGIGLTDPGRRQVARLAETLAARPLAGVYSSPLQRCRETADLIAAPHCREPALLPALQELDYGHWQDRRPADLDSDSHWIHYNQFRSLARIPGGEMLPEAQVRMLQALEQVLAQSRSGETLGEDTAWVSHGDPIRALLCHLLGMPLDFVHRLRVDPASVSAVELDGGEPRLLYLNHTAGNRESGDQTSGNP